MSYQQKLGRQRLQQDTPHFTLRQLSDWGHAPHPTPYPKINNARLHLPGEVVSDKGFFLFSFLEFGEEKGLIQGPSKNRQLVLRSPEWR